MSSGFSVRIDVNTKQALKSIQRVQRFTIPAAKKSAFRHASMAVIAEASTLIAAEAKVPRWMVRGAGSATSKASGSRIGRSGYIKSMDGIILFLRTTHINPAGTAKRQAKVTNLKRGGVRVAGVASYKDGFYIKGAHGGQVYQRFGKGAKDIRPIQIPLDPWAAVRLRAVAQFGLLPRFRNRFKHEMTRRTKTNRKG